MPKSRSESRTCAAGSADIDRSRQIRPQGAQSTFVTPYVDAIRLRELQRREYRDPVPFLKNLRQIEPEIYARVADPEVRQLRTNDLREWREARLGALFCHGMSVRTGQKFMLSKGEYEDADCVASWVVEGEQHFAPIQIKEVVPESRNEQATLEAVLVTLQKYSGRDDLTVLVHLNRRIHFNPLEVAVPSGLRLAALWVMACIKPRQSDWALWGNFMETAEGSSFAYPA